MVCANPACHCGLFDMPRGQNIGRMTGMKRTTCTLFTPETAITYSTASVPAWELLSALQCSYPSSFKVFAGERVSPSTL
jgi:hypothetical protein